MAQFLSNLNVQTVTPAEEFIDPVNKIRVSQPENLIDTDFEYGLQGTKWETLELSNNVPSYYVSDSDLPLADVTTVQATAGSNVITVSTLEPHGLVAGTPIDVRGLTSRTAEGKFLIKSVPTELSFTYVANGIQTATLNIGSIYATITPGQFYSGSQIPFDRGNGIQTNGLAPSTLTINTDSPHGFKVGSSFYLVNSIGTKKVIVNPYAPDDSLDDDAPDGRPYIDVSATVPVSITPNLALTETKEMRSTYYRKFAAADVDINANTIYWPGHGLKNNDVVVYIPSAGDAAIGGLGRFYPYYVEYYDNDRIRLRSSRNSGSVDFTSAGTYNYGRAGLHMAYDVQASYFYSYNYYAELRTYAQWNNTNNYSPNDNNSNSGWDFFHIDGTWGMGRRRPSHVIQFSRDGWNPGSAWLRNYFASSNSSEMQMPETSFGNNPGPYNWIEDFNRYRGLSKFSADSVQFYQGYIRQYDYSWYYGSANGWYYTYNQFYYMFVEPDDEANTFYAAGSNLETGSSIVLNKISGEDITVSTHGQGLYDAQTTASYNSGTHLVERVSSDRFRIRFAGSSTNTRLRSATGSYTFTGQQANPKKDTIYVPSHGFATGDTVRVELEAGGVLPTTATGVITPITTAGTNIDSAFGVINSYLDNYTAALAQQKDLVLDGATLGSNRYMNDGVATGASLLSYMDIGADTYLYSPYLYGQSVNVQTSLYKNQQSSTLVKDLGESSIFANRGYQVIGNDYRQNSTIPHYTIVYGAANGTQPDIPDIRIYNRVSASVVNTHQLDNQSYTINGNAGWRASYGARFATSPSATGYVEFHMAIWNTGWVPGYTHPVYYISLPGNNGNAYIYPSGYSNGQWGKPIMLRTVFLLEANTSYTASDINTLAQNIITNFANNFVGPALSDKLSVKTVVVDQNRIGLKSTTGVSFDFTGVGTAPFSLTQDGVVGTNDGTYKVKEVPTATQFKLDLPFLSARSFIEFNSNSVTSSNLVRTEVDHFFSTGTKITYVKGLASNGINELTNGNEYYLYVQDERYVGFATSYQNAVDGNVIDITAAALSGLDKIEYSVVNGRVSGIGLVSTTSGSKIVKGNGSALFKRYFKVGDNIGIKDPGTSPGRIDTYTIAAIADDNTIELTDVAAATLTDVKYFLTTKLYARPDGYSIHRPFDGGVEIAAGTSPNSQIVRQTRKYFRYQSGKGIQTSLAINFNPPVQFESLEQGTRLTVVKGTESYEVTTTAEVSYFMVSNNPNQTAYSINMAEDPTLTLIRGNTYTFTLSNEGNPFHFQTTNGTGYDALNLYTTGVTVTGTRETGTITFVVPLNAPNTLYYQSQNTIVMNGTINVIDDPGIPEAYVLNDVTTPTITMVRGETYSFNINTPGHDFALSTATLWDSFNDYTNGLVGGGVQAGTVTFTVPLNAPSTLYYTSMANDLTPGQITITNPTYASQVVARGKTRYPHRLSVSSSIKISGASDNTYNGNFVVSKVIDEFFFEVDLPNTPTTSVPSGFIQFNMNGYSGAAIRAGMFDFQNGFFLEFDGTTVYAVRRSSTQQLSGTVRTYLNSNIVTGSGTNFTGQLNAGDFIVIRGGSYKVISVNSRDELIIQPQYKGVPAANIIATKTVDTKVAQENWSIDKCDGTGLTGFNLNLDKIQMCYMDYSWYGAGKIRFGFKDTDGHVKYVHEFIHNNRLDEAYMRSGNLPARYEIVNDDNPTYAPTLFHWGTSVIMDGTFDADNAYLFTGASKSLSFTNGAGITATTNANSILSSTRVQNNRYNYYVAIPFATADASKLATGTKLYTADGKLTGQEIAYTQFSGSSIWAYIFITTAYFAPSVYPSVASGTVVNIGAPAGTVTGAVNLGTDIIPLLTIRLAPSVDSGLSGEMGARETINRMQLKLDEVGLILTHDCEVKLVLNGDLSSVDWEKVGSPSLSNLIKHESGDKIVGGSELFSFRASGGAVDNTGKRSSASSNFTLQSVIDMGNSILGGNGTFPNGPDILTVALKVIDTQGISATSPFVASGRITWSESQA